MNGVNKVIQFLFGEWLRRHIQAHRHSAPAQEMPEFHAYISKILGDDCIATDWRRENNVFGGKADIAA